MLVELVAIWRYHLVQRFMLVIAAYPANRATKRHLEMAILMH